MENAVPPSEYPSNFPAFAIAQLTLSLTIHGTCLLSFSGHYSLKQFHIFQLKMSEVLFCGCLISLWGYLSNVKVFIITTVDIFVLDAQKDSLTHAPSSLTVEYSQGTILGT